MIWEGPEGFQAESRSIPYFPFFPFLFRWAHATVLTVDVRLMGSLVLMPETRRSASVHAVTRTQISQLSGWWLRHSRHGRGMRILKNTTKLGPRRANLIVTHRSKQIQVAGPKGGFDVRGILGFDFDLHSVRKRRNKERSRGERGASND